LQQGRKSANISARSGVIWGIPVETASAREDGHDEYSERIRQERLARLLSSSPAVIYCFNATGDFAPTFVSDNISTVFGYTPAEYLENPSFWRDRFHPDDLARVEEAIAKFFHNGMQSDRKRQA
jgi:PAS domain-containing protein